MTPSLSSSEEKERSVLTMAINALNPNSVQQFRPNGGAPAFGPAALQGGPQQNGGPRGDQMGFSPEAQQAGGPGQQGGAQRLTQALAQNIGQVLQAQSSGDQNSSQQALQGLKQTYEQGAQSGQLEQVPGAVRQTAESLLGINKGEEGQKGGGGCGGGGGGPKEGGGAEEAGDKQGDSKGKFDEETLKKLEELLGSDKAEKCKKDSKCGDKKCDKKDGEDAKTDSKAGETKTDSKIDTKSDTKTDSKVESTAGSKPSTSQATKAPKPTGGGPKPGGTGKKAA